MEELALDRPAVERVPDTCVEAVETGTEERVQACRELDLLELAHEHPAVALLPENPFVSNSPESSSANSGLPAAARASRERTGAGAPPIRLSSRASTSASASGSSPTVTIQSGWLSSSSGRARQQQRAGRCPPATREGGRGDRTGPVRPSGCRRPRPPADPAAATEEQRDRLGGLGGGRRPFPEPNQLRNPAEISGPFSRGDSRLPAGRAPRRPVLVADPGKVAHDLPDRPEGDPFAVGKTAATHDPGMRRNR